MTWHALDITLMARAREAVEYALMEAGALGTEHAGDDANDVARVSAYFDAPPEVEGVRAALLDALRIYELASSDVREIAFREVADADWLAEWKKGWRPVEVGAAFVVAPPWSEIEDEEARIVIRIEPGMAFGTGTHETTRLCLNAIEKHFCGGSFLDVGTGTGILAIAAAKLQPGARIEACDTDPVAVEVARENAELNGVADKIAFRVGSLDEGGASSADVVCANLTADVIAPLLPALLATTRRSLILSGILATQSDIMQMRLRELAIERYEISRDGEWIAMVIHRIDRI
jgi:ribosomal protein L11 methyltransferase